jgi:alpha,alpha-trehalase
LEQVAFVEAACRLPRMAGRWLIALITLSAIASNAIAREWDCGVGRSDAVPVRAADLRTPSELYGELFVDVQMQRVFADGKTFVDALPKAPPGVILEEYGRVRRESGFDLRAFVTKYFAVSLPAESRYRSQPGQDVREHIDTLWPVLTREPDQPKPHSSLLPLPYRYVVPGGRFNEIYYWDSYFTMLGLEASGRHDLTLDMVSNFAWLIARHGHIPNGNRSYYLSRSQPPFFAAMVELVAARDGPTVYSACLPALEREYAFWMEGADSLAKGAAHRRVVRLSDGTVLNRYWDDRAIPREEAWREDVETARGASRPAAVVYRNLRAAAESGWDFSSRWFADTRSLTTIHTTDFLPVDLNSLLYQLEQTLARAYRESNDPARAAQIGARAWARRAAIQRWLWNAEAGVFADYDWQQKRSSPHVTTAALYPLAFGLATPEQAAHMVVVVRDRLLQPDGLATTAFNSGQQWDAPNGWAPLQWIGVKGLGDYGERELAAAIARRWIRENVDTYRSTGKLVEKYDVTGDSEATGGEYPTQDGFGWTNGVLRRLLVLYPAALDRAGSNSSMALPSGSSSWICRPPGPDSISLRNFSPAFLSSSICAGRSVTCRTIRFHPPGSWDTPPGNGRDPDAPGPLKNSLESPTETVANAGSC